MLNMLEVNHLRVWDANEGKEIIRDSSFQLKPQTCLAIVGESGSGKSLTCRSIIRLHKPWIRQSGEILFKGENLNQLSDKEMRRRRGKQIGMIMQNGMGAFDPSSVVGVHFQETLKAHFGWSKSQVETTMKKAMESVMLNHPIETMNKYPYQLSGGMLQRLMIALTLVLSPDIVIADEPTTALDTISQYEVVEQFIQLRERMGGSMIFVSHDLGVVKKIADEVMVMRNGVIVESGSVEEVLSAPRHPYTQYLVSTRLELSNHFNEIMRGE
ncbi:staphylopine uptake ABC transporter ATP-binding protein CntD [Paenibacillus sp. HGF5]|uniref:staphylopine uptake ABC transporter ATP-binding protein CntD n=1 Tax=Paenibacillus sp. HGF5 TaxID=908341 RepID=UPI0002071E14|nr:ABC transporter ATP-binding protein [Paenibacillus sp. HGF5]EGG37412.1 oligopeptide ABC transporter, ATP-binding protein OppD [Paenibacillus sp. HGF5]